MSFPDALRTGVLVFVAFYTEPPMPSTPAKTLETFANPKPERDFHIHMEIPEFTCLCPKTGQPDFATLYLDYIPDKTCVELKSLKLDIWSFRAEGHFHEDVTNRILDDLVKAREYYRQAIQLDPQEALAYYRMGETYTQEEQLQNALASYTKAYKLEQNAEFASAMAYCLAELGETIQATHYYEISVELEKLDLNIWVSYISFLFQEEKYEDALLLIEKARHYLYDVELDYFWAVSLFETGNRKEGLNVFAGALEADWTGRTAFFTWLPHLEQDKEILDMVSLYKPSDNEKS
jgi:7-cyano-7-deazaguanine reductase